MLMAGNAAATTEVLPDWMAPPTPPEECWIPASLSGLPSTSGSGTPVLLHPVPWLHCSHGPHPCAESTFLSSCSSLARRNTTKRWATLQVNTSPAQTFVLKLVSAY